MASVNGRRVVTASSSEVASGIDELLASSALLHAQLLDMNGELKKLQSGLASGDEANQAGRVELQNFVRKLHESDNGKSHAAVMQAVSHLGERLQIHETSLNSLREETSQLAKSSVQRVSSNSWLIFGGLMSGALSTSLLVCTYIVIFKYFNATPQDVLGPLLSDTMSLFKTAR